MSECSEELLPRADCMCLACGHEMNFNAANEKPTTCSQCDSNEVVDIQTKEK